MDNQLLEAALKYLAMGFSVIPVNKEKQPALPTWKEYQQRLPTTEEIQQWFSRPDAEGVAVITGQISGLAVLDVEAGLDVAKLDLPPTVMAKSGGGGRHYYFKIPKGLTIKNSVQRIGKKMDIRGDGGYIVAPPSMHHSGNRYEWIVGPGSSAVVIAEMPRWLIDKNSAASDPAHPQPVATGVEEGSRNTAGASLIGELVHYLPENKWETLAWGLMQGWNKSCNPPLQLGELRQIYNSIAGRERAQKMEPNDEKITDHPLWTIQAIAEHDFGPVKWQIEKLLPGQSIAALSGNPGNYKTWLTLEIAKSVASGKPFLEQFAVTPGAVLFIDEENHLRHLKQRLSLIGMPNDAPIYYLSQIGFQVENERLMKRVLNIIQEKSIKLVIVDSLIRIHSQDENDAGGMAKVSKKLQEFTKAGTSVIFTHHHRKQVIGSSNASQDLRGSSDILAAVDSHMALEKKSEDSLILRQNKMRQDEAIHPIGIGVNKMKDEQGKTTAITFSYSGPVDDTNERFEATEGAVRTLVQNSTHDIARQEIVKTLQPKYGRNMVERAIKSLEKSEKIERVPKIQLDPKNRNAHVYRPKH